MNEVINLLRSVSRIGLVLVGRKGKLVGARTLAVTTGRAKGGCPETIRSGPIQCVNEILSVNRSQLIDVAIDFCVNTLVVRRMDSRSH